MSRHNKDRRKYRCPCGNAFLSALVEAAEADFAAGKREGARLPQRLPHSCGACCKLSVLDGGRFRYMTPGEELALRVEFPAQASFADYAMANDLPDCVGLIPVTPKE